MKSRNKFLMSLTWLLSAAALLWSLWVLNAAQTYQRTFELSQIAQSLEHLSSLLPSESQEQKAVEQSSKNIEGLSDGAILLEEKALHIGAFLMLLTLGFSSLSLLSNLMNRDKASSSPDTAPDLDQNFELMLTQTLEDLNRIKAQLAHAEDHQKKEASRVQGLEKEAADVLALESQLVFLKSQTEVLSEQNQKALENLRQLTGQADDFANFSNASRLEWNALSIRLSQFKEAQGQVRGKTEMLLKTQNANQELLVKTMDFHKLHATHAERAATDVERMYTESKSTTDLFGELIHAMAESRDHVDLANKLVRGLSERAEEIVNIIDVIDDIAEQTNQLALNASIEAARAGEQGKGFAVVAGEVRSLAARSSTATRTITELLETIQSEANHASACLEKTNNSVGNAHGRIQDVEHRCRGTMNHSHQIGVELREFMIAATEHRTDMQTVEKQSGEISRMTQKLLRILDDIDQLNTSVHQESNQLAVHTDRISRLMSRHYFAVQYAERMSSSQVEGFRALLDQSTQALTHSQSLRTQWDEKYRSLMSPTTMDTTTINGANSASELSRLANFCQSNLEVLRLRAPTLALADSDDDINLSSDSAPITGDDSDISITNNLDKAS